MGSLPQGAQGDLGSPPDVAELEITLDLRVALHMETRPMPWEEGGRVRSVLKSSTLKAHPREGTLAYD